MQITAALAREAGAPFSVEDMLEVLMTGRTIVGRTQRTAAPSRLFSTCTDPNAVGLDKD